MAPAGSVGCERLFSVAGWTYGKYRKRMTPQTLRMLLFIRFSSLFIPRGEYQLPPMAIVEEQLKEQLIVEDNDNEEEQEETESSSGDSSDENDWMLLI